MANRINWRAKFKTDYLVHDPHFKGINTLPLAGRKLADRLCKAGIDHKDAAEMVFVEKNTLENIKNCI